MPLKIVAKDAFKIKNAPSSAPLTEDELKEVVGELAEVQDYKEPIETKYGTAYLMQIPNKPQCFQTNFDDRLYNVSFLYGDEFINATVNVQESEDYERYPGCPVFIIGKIREKSKDDKVYKNIAHRAIIILSDKPQDKPPQKVERRK